MATVSPRHRTAPTDAPTVESTTLGASRPPNRATTGISLRVKTLSVVLVTLVVLLLTWLHAALLHTAAERPGD